MSKAVIRKLRLEIIGLEKEIGELCALNMKLEARLKLLEGRKDNASDRQAGD